MCRLGASLKLVFNNDDDMMHNLLIVEPGAAGKVGEQAIALGLAGPNQSYIPEMDEVLFHTVLLEPDFDGGDLLHRPNRARRIPVRLQLSGALVYDARGDAGCGAVR